MCSISGFVSLDVDARADLELVASLIKEGSRRGRDSWGVEFANGTDWRSTGNAHDEVEQVFAAQFDEQLSRQQWAIANCRAEPTTERVISKTTRDVQPFCESSVSVVHNGTIANDQELRVRYASKALTSIDSAVLPNVIAALEHDRAALINALKYEIVGSFALAAATPTQLIIATNYKPLCYALNNRVLYFTSRHDDLADPFACWHQLEPYSLLIIDLKTGSIERESLEPADDDGSLVVCSGGMDSTVCAALEQSQGRAVTLLHYQYGCRAERAEQRAIEQIAERLSVPLARVQLGSLFTSVIGGSRLTGSLTEEISDGVEGAEYAHEWVPARNLIMLSIAVGIAESRGLGRVVLGNNLEEAGAYPDNEEAFIDRLNDVMPYAVGHNKRVTIEMPVGGLMKKEVVELGAQINAPLDLTWSCYEDGDIHCGNCGPCFMRRTAHEMADVPDAATYAQ